MKNYHVCTNAAVCHKAVASRISTTSPSTFAKAARGMVYPEFARAANTRSSPSSPPPDDGLEYFCDACCVQRPEQAHAELDLNLVPSTRKHYAGAVPASIRPRALEQPELPSKPLSQAAAMPFSTWEERPVALARHDTDRLPLL